MLSWPVKSETVWGIPCRRSPQDTSAHRIAKKSATIRHMDAPQTALVGENDALTDLQEQFVRLRVAGRTVRECASLIKQPPSVLRRWCRLPNVRLQLDALVVEVDRARQHRQSDSYDMLLEIYDNPDSSPAVQLGVAKELNRMYGHVRDRGAAGHRDPIVGVVMDAEIIEAEVAELPIEDLRKSASDDEAP